MNQRLLGIVALCLCVCGGHAWAADKTLVRLETNYGDMTLELYGTKAPNTVANFLGYVERGFYEGLIFHRVVPNFVIQAGAYDPNLYQANFARINLNLQDPNYYHEPNAPINLEVTARLKNLRGTVAMARQASPHTATSQFYINIIDNASLNPTSDTNGYAVFGEVSQGMDVADDIASVNLITDADTVRHFPNLPAEPVRIIRASVLRAFEPNSYDLSAVPFLKAGDGTVRTFVGQGAQASKTYRHIFAKTAYLDIQVLKWTIDASGIDGVVPADMYLTKDTAGGLWILKHVLRPGTPEEQVVIQANNLAAAVPFSEYAAEHMQFRLMGGDYSRTDMNDPRNTISVGTGAQQQNEEIVSAAASLAEYPGVELVLVKWSRGPLGAPTEIDWRYYHPELGLVFDLWDNGQDPAGDGWKLAAMNFNSDSANFAATPFLKVPASSTDLVRTYVGQGNKSSINFTQTFSFPATGLQGVKYLRWVQVGSLANGIDSFTLNLARDTRGNIWVFHYELNGQTLLEAESLLEARPFTDYNDRMLFRLINGAYNPADLNDPANTIITGAGATAVTEKIVSTTATVAHIPHYLGHLVQVNRWQGPAENGNHLSYYDDSVGLVAIALDGETGLAGDGWHLAFFGGIFNTDSDDLSSVGYLHAKPGLTRSFLGQGQYAGQSYQHSFTSQTSNAVKCLNWELKAGSTSSTAIPRKWYILLAKDNLGQVWVFRYYVNGIKVFNVGGTEADRFKALPLADFADYNLQFRLMAGRFNLADLAAAENTSNRINNVSAVAEGIRTAAAQLPDWPGYRGAIIRTQRNYPGDPNTDSAYYHESVGPVLDLWDSQALADPNAPAAPATQDGWRLGWYGQTQPTFNYTSSDNFANILYLKAVPGQSRLYRGQGAYAGTSFRINFATRPLLNTNTLQVEETAVAQHDRPAHARYLAKDTAGGLWLFKETLGSASLFAAPNLDQIMPLATWPDLQFRLMGGTTAVGTSVTRAAGGDTVTDKIISTTQQLTSLKNNNRNLLLARSLGTAPGNLYWTYYHQNLGPVLELRDDFYPPELADPNLDNPALILKGGAGWLIAEPNTLPNLKLTVRASALRTAPRDYFNLTGAFQAAAADLVDSVLAVDVGAWKTSIPTSQLRRMGNYYFYSGAPDGRGWITLVIDLGRQSFTLTATNTDLSGLSVPVTCSLSAGSFFATGTATVSGSLPVILLKGLQDGIAATNFRYVSGGGATRLIVTGTMVTQAASPDLAGKQVDISWGSSASQKVTISGDASGLRRLGTRPIFIYTSASGKVNYALFNLERNSFLLVLNSIGTLSFPVNLGVKITNPASTGTTLFDQTAVLKVGS